jgi:carbonic anhydrase
VDSWIGPSRTQEEKEERWKQIEMENVRLQIEHLMIFPFVKRNADEGKIRIYGLYYDLSTGILSRIV